MRFGFQALVIEERSSGVAKVPAIANDQCRQFEELTDRHEAQLDTVQECGEASEPESRRCG